MANITAPTGSEDFAGDEFSNNLFSDLAPLLTLFGEQVTKQFLSMRYSIGMGWADNVLLAMGPLGIMTTIVSAIRVGRVTKLKAMLIWLARARESQSVAEQELLSSTSEDVCELWSGHEIVRVFGRPDGMKNLVISQGKVYDIQTAVDKGIMEDTGSGRHQENYLGSLREAAPNLALNVRNATAPAWELWTWAVVGVILQVIAVAVPALATYHWQWTKAGTKVQNYGYPCFLIGTLLVVFGTMACGHVIEGVTTEYTFAPTDWGKKKGEVKILRLQRACTVSDQHFSSYAIFNNADNHIIRTSRLNSFDYSNLAAISSLVSVAGFIAQFVGLRALHWSATIIQLGITLIMTAIRAWVRRGLASGPVTEPTLEGHEIAWLTIHIVSEQPDAYRSDSPEVRMTKDNFAETHLQHIPPRHGIEEPLCAPLQLDSPLAVQLIEDFVSEDDPMLETFSQIAGLMQVDNEVTHAANSFISVVERVMKILCNSDSIQWRKDGISIPQYGQEDTGPSQYRDFELSWQFTVSTRRFSDGRSKLKRICFGIQKPGEASESYDAADSNRWHFLSPRDSVAGLISLWKYAMARKQKAISTLDSIGFPRPLEGIPQTIATNGVGRIVGTRPPYSEVRQEDAFEPSEWLGVAVDDSPLPDGAHTIRGDSFTRGPDSMSWFLGMFLSTMADDEYPQESRVMVIQTRQDSSLALKFAQELFSLFILAVANNVEQVLGFTTYDQNKADMAMEMRRPTRSRENSVFSEMANEVVSGGLAHDVTEAYSLIIPAFGKCGNLPKPQRPDQVSTPMEDE
ncbi:hypothetical protein BJ166DRAFT_464016 [Pestalotiopsis sp. NC0098]|nr:hypothetical protein BJ166DRAFT_464016 [Pestalotiopsis sp. NC0098]